MGILTVTRVLEVGPVGTVDMTHGEVGLAVVEFVAAGRACGLDDDEIEEDLLVKFGWYDDAQIVGDTVTVSAFDDGECWTGWGAHGEAA